MPKTHRAAGAINDARVPIGDNGLDLPRVGLGTASVSSRRSRPSKPSAEHTTRASAISTPQARYDYVPASGAIVERARRIKAVRDRYDVPLAAAAIRFPFAHPQIAGVLIGARSPDELDMDLDLLRVNIPAELWHDLRSSGLLLDDAPVPSGVTAMPNH